MDRTRYFDHAATTPLDPRVREAMLPYLGDAFGNPNSLHSVGRRAKAAVERAREQVMDAIGAEWPDQIVFTSGSTEASNWVLSNYPGGWMSPFEHSAVREPGLRYGYRTLNNDGLAILRLAPEAPLATTMWVNNEMGTTWTPRPVVGAERLHCDATQALGKVRLVTEDVDFLSLSAHKAYGPKGVGALFLRDGYERAFMLGGEQERGLRAGTLNVPAIVGFGEAASIAAQEWQRGSKHAQELREIVLHELLQLPDWQVNGVPAGDPHTEHVPHILSLSFYGLEGESLVLEADAAGYSISSGAACSAGSNEPSHVLRALGLSNDWIRGTIRISFGRENTAESAAGLGKCLVNSVKKLRTMT